MNAVINDVQTTISSPLTPDNVKELLVSALRAFQNGSSLDDVSAVIDFAYKLLGN